MLYIPFPCDCKEIQKDTSDLIYFVRSFLLPKEKKNDRGIYDVA